MINNLSVLALIPARSGSKRLKNKNTLNFFGQPLLSWSIQQALESSFIDRVVVSTEDKTIAEIATDYGAWVPFLRPSNLALDSTTTADVAVDLVHRLVEFDKLYDIIVLLQPTSPLRTSSQIDESLRLLETSACNSVVSVSECDHHPLWSNIIPEDLSLDNFLDPSILNLRSQDLPVYYRINGAIYSIRTHALLDAHSFTPQVNSKAYIMPQVNSIDIDTRIDFELAKACKLILDSVS